MTTTATSYDLGDRSVSVYPVGALPDRDALSAAGETCLGLDVESTSFGPARFWGHGAYDDGWKLRLIQVATETEVWLIDPAQPGARELFEDERFTFVSHTDTDPVALSVALGVDIIDRWVDTYALAYLTGRKPGNVGLKQLTAEYGMPELAAADAALDEEFQRLVDEAGLIMKDEVAAKPDFFGGGAGKGAQLRAMYGYTKVDIASDTYLRYSALDAAADRRLLPELLAESKSPRPAVELELAVVRENARWVNARGVRVDLELLAKMAEEKPAEYRAAIDAFQAHTGGVNPNSSVQLREYFAERGADFDHWTDFGGALTDTGAPSLGKDNWKTLRQHPLDDAGRAAVELYGDVVSHKNAAMTIDQLRRAVGRDGRLHPQINTLGTDTGRMSSRAPNMQNLKGPMRGLVVADPGHVLVSIDFDGLEAKMAAAISQDALLIAATAPGADFHQATADAIGIKRKQAKTLNFQILFGGGANAVAQALGVSFDEAKSLIKKWWASYPILSRLNKALQAKTDFIQLIDGRQVAVPKFGKKHPQAGTPRAYANLNYMVQGSACLILKACWSYLARAGYGHTVLLPIHDELLLQVPENDVADVLALLEGMNFSYRGVEFTAGVAALYDSEGVSRWVES